MLNHIKVEGMHVQINSLKSKVQKKKPICMQKTILFIYIYKESLSLPRLGHKTKDIIEAIIIKCKF